MCVTKAKIVLSALLPHMIHTCVSTTHKLALKLIKAKKSSPQMYFKSTLPALLNRTVISTKEKCQTTSLFIEMEWVTQ